MLPGLAEMQTVKWQGLNVPSIEFDYDVLRRNCKAILQATAIIWQQPFEDGGKTYMLDLLSSNFETTDEARAIAYFNITNCASALQDGSSAVCLPFDLPVTRCAGKVYISNDAARVSTPCLCLMPALLRSSSLWQFMTIFLGGYHYPEQGFTILLQVSGLFIAARPF